MLCVGCEGGGGGEVGEGAQKEGARRWSGGKGKAAGHKFAISLLAGLALLLLGNALADSSW